MDNFLQSKTLWNLQKETLSRSRRSNSFIQVANDSLCYYPIQFHPNTSEMCHFVTNTPMCKKYVYYLDYLEFLFCFLELPWSHSYVFVCALYLAVLYYTLYMITKYFALPNYMMLMELLPISSFAYSYVYFGVVVFLPQYLRIWLTCNNETSYKATLELSRLIGDVMRYFILGVMVLCVHTYRVSPELLWGNMLFIFFGFAYLLYVISVKYNLFWRHDLPYNHSHLLTLNAWSFLLTFVLGNGIVLIISYHSYKKELPPEDESGELSELPSNIEITGVTAKRYDLSNFKIWWDTVNAFHNMQDRRKIVIIIFAPLYFLLANTIPVHDKRRPMRGWCKPVGWFSLVALPFVTIGLQPDPIVWTTVAVISFFMAFIVFISTHGLREPNIMYMCLYCILGMAMCAMTMFSIFSEINNVIWQYLCMRLTPSADTIPMLVFSSGEIVVIYVFLNDLMSEGLFKAAYGAIMSAVTHTVYMCLPQLVLPRCYDATTYILITNSARTVAYFFVATLFTSLLHVSMSGNEFRMSLFYNLTVWFIFLMFYQFAAYNDEVILFGSQLTIQAPMDIAAFWA